MDAVHQEGGKRTAIRLLLRRGPQNPYTLDGLEPIEQVAGELRFPGLNRLQSDGLQIAEPGLDPMQAAGRLKCEEVFEREFSCEEF